MPSYANSDMRTLGLILVMKRIETAEQKEFLLQHGCDIFQGYYFSKPVDKNQFENSEWIR